jgi:hypothetical protein
MTVSKYFNHIRNAQEHSLYEDLVIENLQLCGMNFWYIPRTYLDFDPILGEPRQSTFESSYEIEGYFKDTMTFGGQGDFLSKWGVTANDVMDLIISKKRFNELLIDGYERPREGDLIYFGDPLNGNNGTGSLVNSLFEITFVEIEVPFWPLGKQYIYQLKCQMFSYNYEKFNTGVISVDTLTNLSVKSVIITNPGAGYITAPTVTFTAAPTGGTTATGTATITDGKVTGVTITNPGSKYIFGPTVTFTAPTRGTTATGTVKTNIGDDDITHGVNLGVQDKESTLLDFSENNPFGAM